MIAHGLIKLILIAAVLKEKTWGYRGLIIVLSLFAAFEIYRAFAVPAYWLLLLAAFDAMIAILATKEYGSHRKAIVGAK